MKPENLGETGPALHQVLREWEVRDTLPPRFGEQVWLRIAREEAQAPGILWSQLLARLGHTMLRPSLAVSYLTVLLLGGLAAGYWHARLDNARAAEQLGARYVQMIAPYEPAPR